MYDQTLPEAFVRALLANQGNLHVYIASLLGNPQQAEEVLQETNVVLCRQADEFPTIANFTAWAMRVAYFQVLTYRKRHQRDRHTFDDQLLGLIAQEAASPSDDFEDRLGALAECLGQLPESPRNMILRRYQPDNSLETMSFEYGRSVGAIKQLMYRIRTILRQCVERRLATAK
jgi:RNA polymerase sigma-70 factor, ECF subfamily